LSQTPGPIAARQYNCGNPAQTVVVGANVSFVDSGIGFGTTLPTGTTPFTNFLLQPGIYQAHLSISNVVATHSGISLAFFNQTASFAAWLTQSGAILSGDRLFSVTQPNTTLLLLATLSSGIIPPIPTVTIDGTSFPCVLILTQLH
jgi:hypothetical protein